jgi:hypothetical protein
MVRTGQDELHHARRISWDIMGTFLLSLNSPYTCSRVHQRPNHKQKNQSVDNRPSSTLSTMLRYLIPVISLLTKVQAVDFPSPVNIQFISNLVDIDHPVYIWTDATDYRNNYTEGILHPPMITRKPEVVGNLNFTHADDWMDRRTISLYKDGETMQTVDFFRSQGSWLTIISAQLGLAKTQD